MELYTKTAIEASLMDQGIAAGLAIGAVIRATPVLISIGVIAWIWHLIRAMGAVGFEGRDSLGVGYRLFGLTLMMMLGWTSLAMETNRGMVARPIDEPSERYDTLPGVTGDPAYDRIMNPSRGLFSFAIVNGAFEQVSAVLTGAVAPPPDRDPGALLDQLIRMNGLMMSEAGHGEEVLQAADALVRNCTRKDPMTAPPGTPLEDLFVQNADPLDASGTDCIQLYRNLEDEIDGDAEAWLDREFGWTAGWDYVAKPLVRTAGEMIWGMTPEETDRWVRNMVVEGTLQDAAKRGSSPLNKNILRKDEATFSDNWDTLYEVMQDPASELGIQFLSTFDPNAGLRSQRAAAVAQFNNVADMMPTMRGFLSALFALTFPLCAYAMCLGHSGMMKSWLTGRAILMLYQPAAAFLYSIVNQYSAWNDIIQNPEYAYLYSAAPVVGAVQAMEAEILRIETAYVITEIVVFTSFAFGATRPLLLGGWAFAGAGLATFATVGRAIMSGPALAVEGPAAAGAGRLGSWAAYRALGAQDWSRGGAPSSNSNPHNQSHLPNMNGGGGGTGAVVTPPSPPGSATQASSAGGSGGGSPVVVVFMNNGASSNQTGGPSRPDRDAIDAS